MFCPQCGSTQSDELKFCKACGANLGAVRQAVSMPKSGNKFDWNKTWVAEMLLSGEESVKRAAELERLQGITPESKRRNEIKAGVITASIGVGLMITLFVLMQGIVLSGQVTDAVAQILLRVWVAGVIPLLVGFALVINGAFVSKRGVTDTETRPTDERAKELDAASAGFLPPPAETNPLQREVFSITDETTRHLEEPLKVKRSPGS
jgi:hypothetical protein